MAKSGEHRMLFDLRGRRKRVIQVAYAGLALIMALSLFTVVGPVNLGDLFGNGSSGSSSSAFDDQAQRLERKLSRDPRNESLLVQDVKARYTAGNSQIQYDPNTGAPTGISEGAVTNFSKAADAWNRYVKLNPKQPNANVAQLAATSFLYSAAASTAVEFSPTIKGAAQAQAIFAEAKPSLNAYLTLARYRFFAGDMKGAEDAGRKAVQEAPKTQQAAVKQAVAQYRQQGEQIQKQVKAASKFNPNGGGKQALENPLGGLSGGGAGTGASAP